MMSMLITIRAHDDVPNNSSGAKREGRGERTVALIRGCLMLYWRETELERETANSGVGSKKRGSMKACGTHGRSLHIIGGWEWGAQEAICQPKLFLEKSCTSIFAASKSSIQVHCKTFFCLPREEPREEASRKPAHPLIQIRYLIPKPEACSINHVQK